MKKGLKISLIVICSVVGALVVGVGGYVGYVFATYSRLGDQELTINKRSNLTMDVNDTFSCSTYNIGFGAYSQDYTFFLDTGYDDDGKETCGHYSKAFSKDEVIKNTTGSINTIKEINPDFMLFQEVDTSSTRSYHVNQDEMINNEFATYDSYHAVNYHSAFLAYPLYDMHGKSNAGLSTLSKYQMQEAFRKEYTISKSFSKFFDLDRCFAYSSYQVSNGKTFYLVNSHMSAYDKGGTIRQKQMAELNAFLKERQDNGDYVVVGGDFNHDLITYNPDFNYNETTSRAFNMTKKTPDWVSYFFEEDGSSPLIDGYKVVASDNIPTCRNNDIEWEEGNTFTCVVDGFIVSSNINITLKKNILTLNGSKGVDGFAFSDHQPAYIEFTLL